MEENTFDTTHAFEKLVIAATASLQVFTNLTALRIRFVDLDSPNLYMNPYFQIKDGMAYGLYNESILHNLSSLPTPIDFAEEASVSEADTDELGLVFEETESSYNAAFEKFGTREPRRNRVHVSQYRSLYEYY